MATLIDVDAVKAQVAFVINDLGNTVTVDTYTNDSEDAWGNTTRTLDSTRDIKGVPDVNFVKKFTWQSAGAVEGASLQLIVEGTESFDPELDKVVINGVSHRIMSVEEYRVDEELLAQSLFLGSE